MRVIYSMFLGTINRKRPLIIESTIPILLLVNINMSFVGLTRLKYLKLDTALGWEIVLNSAFTSLTRRLKHLDLADLHPLHQVSQCTTEVVCLKLSGQISGECWTKDTTPSHTLFECCKVGRNSVIPPYSGWRLQVLAWTLQIIERKCFRHCPLGYTKFISKSGFVYFVIRYHSDVIRRLGERRLKEDWSERDWLQAVPVPHATSLRFSNYEAVRQDHFPFALEDCGGLQELYWSGQAVHMKQLDALNGISMSQMTRMSLSSSRWKYNTSHASISLDTIHRRDGALAHFHNLRILKIENCSCSSPGLLTYLLPLMW